MAKNTPAWKTLGMDAPPPAVNGYHCYGVVWCAEDGPQRESLRDHLGVAAWSMRYWWTKVAKDIAHGIRERRSL